VTEVQLSNWNAQLHSNTLMEMEVPERFFMDRVAVAGPILAAEPVLVGGDADSKGGPVGRRLGLLLAYEHGSQMPDTFLRFDLHPDRRAELVAVKGNYVPGLGMRRFDTVWMEAAVSAEGIEGLAAEFRRFVAHAMDTKGGSRKPYLFFNTWNFQERDKWWNGKDYLASYTESKLLAEIEVAHRLGVEMFSMDTGWYSKAGDWDVDLSRFPNGLKPLKAKLDGYGMRFGVWNNPTMAAISSKTLAANRGCVMSWKGKQAEPQGMWGSESSYPMCLVSQYSDVYAETLIRLVAETGASYLYWDAVSQYGCDSPEHWHGGPGNSAEECSDSYAFQLPLQLVRIVEKVRHIYPEMIFDFDVTETGRAVGLSFLSAGRYFLVNNGPYLADYDLPHKDGAQNDNLFFYPGAARTWICRKPLDLDRWIPSNLLITHYFTDDPLASQLVNMATLVLGQNGLWGSLTTVSESGVAWLREVLSRYLQVRQDVMESDPIVRGEVASSYEAHEKINPVTGKGVVALFSVSRGRMTYVTEHRPSRETWATDGQRGADGVSGVTIQFDAEGHAVIESQMELGAAIVFFGVQ
jgi:alpha-galactosidase